jgi:hypothetical protein
MKNALTMILTMFAVGVVLGEPSRNHVALQKAAEWAVTNSNIELLRALLQAGVQIDEPVDNMGWTMLHFAAIHNQPRVVRFLLDNGAETDVRGKYGDRPIDLAFNQGQTNVCQLLEKPARNEELVCDIPESVLLEIISPGEEDDAMPPFVSLNGTNAPAAMIEWLRGYLSDVRPASQAKLIEDPQTKLAYVEDKETRELGRLFDIVIKKTTDGYDWSVRSFTGSVAGWGQSGKLIKRYGCWFKIEVHGWQS